MPVWLKAALGSLAGTLLGAALGFAGCAAVVMLNGGWSTSSEKFLVGVLVYGAFAILSLAAVGFILGLVLVLNRQKRSL